MKKLPILLFTLSLMLGLGTLEAKATLLSVNYLDNPLQTTSGNFNPVATAADMAGMNVSVTWGNGVKSNYIWEELLDGESGFTSADGVSMTFAGSTISSPWTVTASNTITSITFDAGSTDAVFDVIFNSNIGPETPGTNSGMAISSSSTIFSRNNFDIVATYWGAVAKEGFDPAGDIYRYLTIDFTGDFGGTPGDALTFKSDTDKVTDMMNPAVPIPGAIWLLGSGLLGLVCIRRRKHN